MECKPAEGFTNTGHRNLRKRVPMVGAPASTSLSSTINHTPIGAFCVKRVG
jgi:hypothetical protein